MAEKNFEGCGGLVITNEIKVCIASQACLLLLHRSTDCYRALRSILVYPNIAPKRFVIWEEESWKNAEMFVWRSLA